MTLPPRLSELDVDSFELSALRSAEHDRGSPEAFKRVLGAISLGAAVPAPIAAEKPSLVALKGLLAGFAIGAGGVAVSAVLFAPEPARERPVLAQPRAQAASIGVVASREIAPALATSVEQPVASPSEAQLQSPKASASSTSQPRALSGALSASSVEAPTPSSGAAAPSADGSAARGENDSELSREIALLDEARRQLALGHAAAALAALDRREREVRSRVLGFEALQVRVEALWAAGERTRARALLESAIAHTSNDAQADRLRRLLSQKIP
ncbi:MAG TPA: hypothetical protein VFK05_26365 [Polyangiaceae bacterium]|nr:hypothetical protein [Polyangiaceae bacterium]